MAETKVVNNASSKPKSFFQTLRELMRQRERIDHQILKLQGRIFRDLSKASNVKQGERKTYVPRMANTITLIDAIHKCMPPNEKMTMDEVLTSLQRKGLYRTNSGYFYTMVNNKLNNDKRIDNHNKNKSVLRGVFIYYPNGIPIKKKAGQKSKGGRAA